VTTPGVKAIKSSGPTKHTLDIKMVDKNSIVFIAGPGNLTTVRATYQGM